MSILLLKFAVTLKNEGRHGLLFHRWLPDGEKDAILLDTGDSNVQLQIWFERRGFVNENGYVECDDKRHEVDSASIDKQAILEAGPLMGLLEIQGLSDEEIETLCENKIGNDNYMALAKKIVQKWLHPPILKFLNILRIHYGQYWITEIEKWDLPKLRLGYSCYVLGLQWSLDEGKTWSDFIPERLMIVEDFNDIWPSSKYTEYLTKADWQELGQIVREGYEPSLALHMLTNSRRALDQGNIKLAFIEGVTALELAISDLRKSSNDKSICKFLAKRRKSKESREPKAVKAVKSVATICKISSKDIKHTRNAVEIRNGIVHEGKSLPIKAEIELRGLLRTVVALLSGTRLKFPSVNWANAVLSPEKWEKQEFGDPL